MSVFMNEAKTVPIPLFSMVIFHVTWVLWPAPLGTEPAADAIQHPSAGPPHSRGGIAAHRAPRSPGRDIRWRRGAESFQRGPGATGDADLLRRRRQGGNGDAELLADRAAGYDADEERDLGGTDRDTDRSAMTATGRILDAPVRDVRSRIGHEHGGTHP